MSNNIYTKLCPACGKDMVYNGIQAKILLYQSIKKNKTCKDCYHKRKMSDETKQKISNKTK